MPRAAWFPKERSVELRDEPLPDIGPGDLHVRAVASAISHGTEMLVYRGEVPPDLALDLPTLRGSFRFPIKYGYASVGRVIQAGAEAGVKPGSLVFALHPHQDHYLVPASLAVPLNDATGERGVFLANLETAVNVMLDAAPRFGEQVVVMGQGVVGLLVTQIAVRSGARVIAVDPLEKRRLLARRLGAEAVLTPGEHLPERVRDLTGGRGADVVIEASGVPAALDVALRCVVFQGTVVACSWYGAKPVALDLGGPFHRGRLRVVSSQVSNIDPALAPRWTRERRLAVARDLLDKLELDALVTHRLPIHRAAEAYELIDQHPEECVQVLFEYDSD